jgi:ribosomal protein L37AE/L43A
MKSLYVCKVCGLTIHKWGKDGTWKHCAGGKVKSCGKAPRPVLREHYIKTTVK